MVGNGVLERGSESCKIEAKKRDRCDVGTSKINIRHCTLPFVRSRRAAGVTFRSVLCVLRLGGEVDDRVSYDGFWTP